MQVRCGTKERGKDYGNFLVITYGMAWCDWEWIGNGVMVGIRRNWGIDDGEAVELASSTCR